MLFFCASKDPKKELWDGPVTGPEGAKHTFGADMVTVKSRTIELFTIFHRHSI
jgi:Aminopeptidase P, N-terminal domain